MLILNFLLSYPPLEHDALVIIIMLLLSYLSTWLSPSAAIATIPHYTWSYLPKNFNFPLSYRHTRI